MNNVAHVIHVFNVSHSNSYIKNNVGKYLAPLPQNGGINGQLSAALILTKLLSDGIYDLEVWWRPRSTTKGALPLGNT